MIETPSPTPSTPDPDPETGIGGRTYLAGPTAVVQIGRERFGDILNGHYAAPHVQEQPNRRPLLVYGKPHPEELRCFDVTYRIRDRRPTQVVRVQVLRLRLDATGRYRHFDRDISSSMEGVALSDKSATDTERRDRAFNAALHEAEKTWIPDESHWQSLSGLLGRPVEELKAHIVGIAT